MASMIDSFTDALNENNAYLKIAAFAIPVYFAAKMFFVGKMFAFAILGGIVALLLLGLLTQGINNVRRNRNEILCCNPLTLIVAIIVTLIAMVPWCLVLGGIGYFLTKITIPIELPHTQLVYDIIVWSILFSIIFTAYLSYAKYMKITQAFNMKVIGESCIDVFIAFLFFLPQLALANIVIIGPVAYLYFAFHLPFDHWGMIAYCSLASIFNISMIANYLAQIAFEQIKGNNEEFDDNVQINMITDTPEKFS